MKEKQNPEWEKATHQLVSEFPPSQSPLRIEFTEEQKLQRQALMNKTPLPELVADKEAIRAALKESRRRHTVRVRSILP